MLGGLEPLLPDELIQRDAAVLLQGDGVLVTGKDTGCDVGIVCSGLRQHSLQRCIQRIGILIIGACTTGEKPQLGRQHPRCQNTQNDCQRTERQHNTGLALCRLKPFFPSYGSRLIGNGILLMYGSTAHCSGTDYTVLLY